MKKVLICEKYTLIRHAFSQILLTAEDSFIVSETKTADELLLILNKEYFGRTCDLIIINLLIFEDRGLEIIRKIKQSYPHIHIIAFTIDFNDQLALRSINAGASGYITAESAPEELLQTIQVIITEGKYLDPKLSEIMSSNSMDGLNKPLHTTLSNREYQVLTLIASGKTAVQIATELSIGVKSISTYRKRILEKMRMKTNAELTHYAIHNKLA
jgi:DNA-binding NarL/FixJ family response regulator